MAEQQKQISLSEALEILKGNLDLLTASEIKQAKEVIDREGTPADKAYVNKLDTHFVNRVLSNKKEDNALTIEQLNLIPDMIGSVSLSNEEKIEALNKWRELSHETLKDIVSDKGETIEPTVYEDILELADKVYVNNADAKSKVVLTIERAKKLYDDENGLSNPKLNEQVLEANLDAFETIYSELKSSEEKAPELVEMEKMFSNMNSVDEQGKSTDITEDMMDATWQEIRQEVMVNPEFAQAPKEKQKQIILDKFKSTARASAFNLILSSEHEGNAAEFAKEIQTQIKNGKTNAEVKNYIQGLSKNALSSKLKATFAKFEKVTSGIELPKSEKIQVSQHSFLSNLAALSVKIDGFSARLGQKFGNIPVVKKLNEKTTAWADRVQAKHPSFKWFRVAGKVATKIAPSIAMTGAVLLTAGSGIALPVAAVAAAYRFRRGTKRFLSDFHEKSKEAEERGEKLSFREYWKNSSLQDKLKIGSAALATVGLGSFALLHVNDIADAVSNVADASDAVNNTTETAAHITETSAPLIDNSSIYQDAGMVGRKVQMAGGGVMGALAAGMGIRQFRTWYNGLSADEKKKFNKKVGITGGVAALGVLAVYTAYKIYDNKETSNINELIDNMMSKNPKTPENIDFDRAVRATAGMAMINPELMEGVPLPEGVSLPEGKTFADLTAEERQEIINKLDKEGRKTLLFNIMKENDADKPDELLDLVLDNEIAENPEEVNDLFNRLNSLGQVSVAEGKEITQEVKNDLIKQFIIAQDKPNLTYSGVDASITLPHVNNLSDVEEMVNTLETMKFVADNRDAFNDYISNWKSITGDELNDQTIVQKMINFGYKTLDELTAKILDEKIENLDKGLYHSYKEKLELSDEAFEKAFVEHKLSSLDSIRDFTVNQSVSELGTEELQSVLNSAHENGLVTDDMLPEVDGEKVAFESLTEEQQREVLKQVINADNDKVDRIKDVADLQAHIKDLELEKAIENLEGKEDIAKELGIEGSGENGAVTDEDIKEYMKINDIESVENLQAEANIHKEITAIPEAEKDALAEHLGIDKENLDVATTLDDEIGIQMKEKGFDSVEALKADKALSDELTQINGENNGLDTAYKANLIKLGYGDAEDGLTVDEVKEFMKEHELNSKAELDAYIAEQTAPITLSDEQVNMLGAAENGVKIELPQVDNEGNPVLGEDGKPLMQDKTADVKAALESLKENGKYEDITRHDLEAALEEKGFSKEEIQQVTTQLNDGKVLDVPVAETDLSQINGEWKLNFKTPEGYNETRFEKLNHFEGNSEQAAFFRRYLYEECFKDGEGKGMSPEAVIEKVKLLDQAGELEGKPAEMNAQEYLYSRNMLRSYVGGITSKNIGNYLAEAKISKEDWESVLNGTAGKETIDAIFKTNLGPYAARLLMDKDINCDGALTVSQQAIIHRGIATLNWDAKDEFSGHKIGYYKGPGSLSFDDNPYKVYNKNLSHAEMSIDCEGTEDVHGKGAFGPGKVSSSKVNDIPTDVPNNDAIDLPKVKELAALNFSENNFTEFQNARGTVDIIEYREEFSNTPMAINTHTQFYNVEEVQANGTKLPENGLAYDKNGNVYRIVNGKISNGEADLGKYKIGKVYPKLDDNGNLMKDEHGRTIFERDKHGAIKVQKGFLGGSGALETSVQEKEVTGEVYKADAEVINKEIKTIAKETTFDQKTGLYYYTVGDRSKYFLPTQHGLVEMAVDEKTGNVRSVIRTYEEHGSAPNLSTDTQKMLYAGAQEKLAALRETQSGSLSNVEYQQTVLERVGAQKWATYELHPVQGEEDTLVMKADHGVMIVSGGNIEYLHEGNINQETHNADMEKARNALEIHNRAATMGQTDTHRHFEQFPHADMEKARNALEIHNRAATMGQTDTYRDFEQFLLNMGMGRSGGR